jgi:hypothetical protein
MSFDHTILKGTSSKIIEVILRDSTTGAGKTAVAYTDVTASYVREGSTRTAITLASGIAGDAYSSGKWCEVDATNCPGLYQLHLPDAALATGVNAVTTTMIASGVIDKVVRISLLDVDLRDATDAGLSSLDAAISSRSTFNSASDQVTVSTNNDKTGYSISGTKTTLDALNDIAASAIVSGGAITTSGGAVSNVTTVATTTTNTDMRGTDNAFLAASAPANFGSLGINASGHLLRTVLNDTTTTNTDMVSVTGLSTFDAATDQVIVGTNTDKTDYALSSAANDAIGAAFLAYTLTKGSPGTIERAFWQSLKATQLADGEVSGTPTASAFDTNLTAVTGAYDHLLLLFTSGSLAGEARPIATYNSTNGRITLQEALTAAPSSSDEFIVVPDHTDPISEIYAYFTDGSNEDAFKADVSALATQASVDTIDGIVDAIKVKTDELTFTVPGSVDATATADVDEAAIAAAVVAGIGGADVTISSPVASDGTTVTIVRGDDYNSADGRSIVWTGATSDQWPDLSGATVVLTAINQNDILRKTLTVTQATGTQQFNMQLTNEETEITSGRYKYDVQATLASGNVITMLVGELIVKKSYAELGA